MRLFYLFVLSLSSLYGNELKLVIGHEAQETTRNGERGFCSFPDSPFVKRFSTKKILNDYEVIKIEMSHKGRRSNPVISYEFIGENSQLKPGFAGSIFRIFERQEYDQSFPKYFYLETNKRYSRWNHFFADSIDHIGIPTISKEVVFHANPEKATKEFICGLDGY